MASYQIIENGIEIQDGTYSTFDPAGIAVGVSRFIGKFTADNGSFVQHLHEIASVDPVVIDQQLKETLNSFNNSIVEYSAPDINTDTPVEL